MVAEHRLPRGKQAKTLYYSPGFSNDSEKVLYTSLQGLAAKHSDEQIISNSGTVQQLKPYMESSWGVTFTDTLNGEKITLPALVEHYVSMGFIKGYVLCSTSNGESYNLGITLAGLLDALIATEQTKDMLEDLGLSCLEDVSDKDDAWLRQSEYWALVNRDVAFEQHYSMLDNLGDYAVLCGAYFNFYDGHDKNEHTAMYDFLNDNAVVFGWNNTLGELYTVASFAQLNAGLIPSDFAANVSTFSGFYKESLAQKRNDNDLPEKENVHTVAFLMTDGDNLQWLLNTFTHGESWYGSPLRGSFDMSWGLPALAIDTTAPLVEYFYDTMTDRDEFVMSLSGLGYTFPASMTPEARSEMTAQLAQVMGRADLRYAEILDNGGWKKDVFADFTEHEEIEGLLYIDFMNYAGNNGSIMWVNEKPVVAARYAFSDGKDGAYFDHILEKINSAPTNPAKKSGYSLITVHCWSCGMSDVEALIAGFNENVDVVTVSEFMDRIVYNLKR